MDFKTIVGSFARTAVVTYGGTLVNQGLVSADDLTALGGAAVVLVGLAWSLVQKYLAKKAA